MSTHSTQQHRYSVQPIPPHQKEKASHSSTSASTQAHRISMDSTRRRPREVRFGDYVLGSTLGEGEFGKVKLGWKKDAENPSQAAIKLIKRDSIPTGSKKESKIHREVSVLKNLRHPNIVKLLEVVQNEKYIGIVLDYASGGELFDYILQHKFLKEPLACRLFSQLVSSIHYMHAKGIVHRDLKLENILLDKHINIIVTDFGFANTFKHSNGDLMKTSCGSPCYAAPELVLSSEPYEAKKVDIWSSGIILYAMLAGYLPFDDDPSNPDGSNILRLYNYITSTSLTFPEWIRPNARDLLRNILKSNPNERISLKEIRSHQWLKPHRPFLSVTPIEWDRNFKPSHNSYSNSHKNNHYNHINQDRINRRMSLMENPTSASLMLNKPNIKSYSSTNVQSVLYSNPAAPQTSRAVAIPSAETSPVASPIRQANHIDLNTAGMNNKTSNNSINRNSNPYSHSRSGSSASIALQACVDADVEIKRRYSNSSNDTLNNQPTVTVIGTNNHGQRPVSLMPLQAPNDNFETINESPENSKLVSTEIPPNQIPVFKKPIVNSTVKLPSSRINKPRPTSYHPVYSSSNIFTSSSNSTTSELPYLTTSGIYSESSLKNQRAKLGNSSDFSITSESLISTSTRGGSVTPILASPMENKEAQIYSPSNDDTLTKSLERLSLLGDSNVNTNNGDMTIDNEEAEKENREARDIIKPIIPIPAPTTATSAILPVLPSASSSRSKRFSLLTFYQNLPEVLTTVASEMIDEETEPAAESDPVPASTPTALKPSAKFPTTESLPSVSAGAKRNVSGSSTTSLKAGTTNISTKPKVRKPLVPSNANIKPNSRVASGSGTAINAAGSKNHFNEAKPDDTKNDRESNTTTTTSTSTSTAKKVMDFFKRRSMRV